MRAAVITKTGMDRIEIRDDVEVEAPGPGEVLVEMKATGVCHSDLSAMDGSIPQPTPSVLGHEGAGVVSAVGEGVTSVAVGDHVIAAWIAPCGRCDLCLKGQANLCMELSMSAMVNPRFRVGDTPYWGMAGTGTFAERAVLAEEAVIKIPDDVPFEVAALIGCGVTTGVGAAINTAKVKVGASVCVIGAGGVGIAVVQGARICGAAEIVVVDVMEAKAKNAMPFGATHSATPDTIAGIKRSLTGDVGFDYVFDVVGNPTTIRQAYDLTRRGGECIVVGMGSMEEMVEFNAFELLFMEKTLKGALYGSSDVRTEFPRLLNLWRNGRLDLEGMISSRLPLEDLNDAFTAMKTGEVIRQIITF